MKRILLGLALSLFASTALAQTAAKRDDGPFVVGTDFVMPMGCVEETDTITTGGIAAVKCGADRELDVDAVLGAGSASIGTLGANSGVDIGDVTLTAGSASIGVLGANSGVDIGDVTINNDSGVGGSGAGIPRVTIASDSHGSVIAERGIRISAAASSTAPSNVDNGDMVSLWSLQNGQLVVQLASSGTLHTAGGGTEASAVRVTLANDSTGLVSVDDNGGSLTVDGTVTANAGTNLNTSALALESGGNLAAIATSLAIIDDWDDGSDRAEVVGAAAHDAAVAGAPVLTGAYAETASASAPGNRAGAAADAVRISANRDGALYVLPHGQQIWEDSDVYSTTQTDASLEAAPGAGLSLYVTDMAVTCNEAGTVTIEDDDTADDVIWQVYCDAAGSGAIWPGNTPHKLVANHALLLTTSGDIDVFVAVRGYVAP